jgi:hypothetical protein
MLKKMTIKEWLEREKKKAEIFEADTKDKMIEEFYHGQLYIIDALLHLLPTFDNGESNE